MGCSADVEDEEETSKWEKTVKVDATKLPDGFARAFEQFDLGQAQAFRGKLNFNFRDEKREPIDALYGFVFDLNLDKDENDEDIEDSYNFVLFGINPKEWKYRVQRFTEVSLKNNNGVIESDTIGNCIDDTGWKYFWGAWAIVNNTEIFCDFSVTQTTPGTYVVKVPGLPLTFYTYTRTEKLNKDPTQLRNVSSDGYAQGGIALFTTAKPGQTIVFTGSIEEESYKGNLSAE